MTKPAKPMPTLERYLARLDSERHIRRMFRDQRGREEIAKAAGLCEELWTQLSPEDRAVAEANWWRRDPELFDQREAEHNAAGTPASMRAPRYWYDIPMFPRTSYQVSVAWKDLERLVASWMRDYGLDLDPPFQRTHVWTRAQQTAYVEYELQGGEVGRTITFNCPGWQHGPEGRMEIVDGKQRVEAVRAFLRDDFPVFGRRCSEWSGSMRLAHGGFEWRVMELSSRADLLRLYLSINGGGTPHTLAELERVRALLVAETAKERVP